MLLLLLEVQRKSCLFLCYSGLNIIKWSRDDCWVTLLLNMISLFMLQILVQRNLSHDTDCSQFVLRHTKHTPLIQHTHSPDNDSIHLLALSFCVSLPILLCSHQLSINMLKVKTHLVCPFAVSVTWICSRCFLQSVWRLLVLQTSFAQADLTS